MMKWLWVALVCAGCFSAGKANAQATVVPTCSAQTLSTVSPGTNHYLYIDVSGDLCVNATVSASISGFTPGNTFATLTATAASSASTALPAGETVALQNVGTEAVSCVFASGAATATASKIIIQPGSTKYLSTTGFDHTACIDQATTGSNLVVLVGGSGLGTDSGGGSGGSGGGGAVTIAESADVAEGATTDAASSAGGTGTVSAKLRLATTQLNTGNGSAATTATNTGTTATNTGTTATALGAPGDSVCGTATGTCSVEALIKFLNTAATAAIPAGTNLVGNTGILYPAGSTPITASATGTTGATTATLAGTSGKSTYVCGFSIRANATAAATADSTVTGTVTGTLHYTQWTAPLASGIGLTEQIFSPCIIASGTNTGIAVISAAPGSGGVVSVSAWGFQL